MSEFTTAQRYAAAGLMALALKEAQRHRSGLYIAEEKAESLGSGSKSEDVLWTSRACGILENVFRCLLLEESTWGSIERVANSPDTRLHVTAFIASLSEEATTGEKPTTSPASAALQLSGEDLNKLANDPPPSDAKQSPGAVASAAPGVLGHEQRSAPAGPDDSEGLAQLQIADAGGGHSGRQGLSKPEGAVLSAQRKVAVLYELVYACVQNSVAGSEREGKKLLVQPGYDARDRVALRLLAQWLGVEWRKVAALEVMVAHAALAAATARKELAEKEQEEEAEKAASQKSWRSFKRAMYVGSAAVAGGTLLAVTGGLAAPAIGAGIAAFTSGSVAATAALATTTAGTATIGAAFGAAGAGLGGYKMARRTADVSEFEFQTIGDNHGTGRLAVGIFVAGMVLEQDDVWKPWEQALEDADLERFAIRWESEELIKVARSVQDWISNNLAQQAVTRGAMLTVLQGLVLALAWPAAVVSALGTIDSRWAVIANRADKAGLLLADALLQRKQGDRPVTLVGTSLGARVVFSCLEELAQRGDTGGIVERAVLLGLPMTHDAKRWDAVRRVVAGRLVNGYSTSDWTLGIVYRANFMTTTVAGLQPIDHPGVDNVDVTDFVKGHSSYLHNVREVMARVNIDSYYPVGGPSLPSDQVSGLLDATPKA